MVLAMVAGAGCGGPSGGDPMPPGAPAGSKEAPVARETTAGETMARKPVAKETVPKDQDDVLRKELVGIWSKVRTAFAEYRLDDALPYLDVPAGEARPSREDARALAEFLPDIDKARFIVMEREGDIVAIATDTSHDPGETEVTVFRFQRVGDRWKIYPSPHSCSSLSVEKTDDDGIRKLAAERPFLRPVPGAE
jgi:hypothetical protein